jgi:plastocyanin
VSTVDRFARICSGLAALTAGATLGVMLNATTVNAAPPPPPVGTAGVPRVVAAAQPATGPRIEIKKHKFDVPTITVPLGATVTWVNHDDDAHTVTSTTALFRSPGLDTDDTFSYRFTKPGTYKYFCTLHPLMVGTVIVR